jgi:thymidylate kinase
MLILEGTDLVGKTTLCHKLCEQLPGYIYMHLTRPPKTNWSDIDYINIASVKSVRDRFHLSELAYSRIRKDESLIKEPRILDAELVTRFCAFKVLICADEDLLRQRYAEKDRDEMYSLDQIVAANNIFKLMSVFADHRLVMTKDKPWPTDEDVRTIVKVYTARLLFWEYWKDIVSKNGKT